jgi:hypothetical protein
MKHVGKMKNNSTRVVVAYRTLPDDAHSALVVATGGLGDSYHDTLMTLVESDNGQQANELAEILSARRFPDGSNMLGYLHSNGHLKKVPTTMVIMTPDNQTAIPLDKLNDIIAQQKGIALEDLAVNDGTGKTKPKKVESNEIMVTEKEKVPTTAAEMRSKANALYKEAAKLRREADDLDPPKSKTKKVAATVE